MGVSGNGVAYKEAQEHEREYDMKYYGDAQATLDSILKSFENGEIPKKMSQVFVSGAADLHCNTYSFMNRLIVALMGYSDARGYGQWKKIGRYVKKGEKGFAILAPVLKNVKENKLNETTGMVEEKSRKVCVGFKAIKVFGLEQTEGKPIENDGKIQNFLNELPLLDVAKKWGIEVKAYNGKKGAALGMYSPGKTIALGTKNLSTWTHELAHAADDKLGNLKNDQRWLSEVAAELAGAALLEAIGYTDDSDRGGCWEYISHYAQNANVEPIDACRMVIGRVSKIMDLILETANDTEVVTA